jgi:hypothetical protein
MPYERRQFLKTSAGITLGSLASSITSFPSLFALQNGRASAAVFWEDTFATDELLRFSKTDLQRALNGFSTVFLTAAELTSQLSSGAYDLLIMPFGSHFPMSSFSAIMRFLNAGGNLLNIGGTPFAVPWTRSAQGFTEGLRQVNYHKLLGITQSFSYGTPKKFSVVPNEQVPIAKKLSDTVQYTAVNELYYRFADTNDFPNESGTAGTQDAVLTPLVWIADEYNERRYAPVVQVDHLRGAYSGGRWVFVTIEGSVSPEAVALLAEQAIGGTVQLSAMPGYACYKKGELPSVTIRLRFPGGNAATVIKGKCSIEIRSERDSLVGSQSVMLTGNGGMISADVLMERRSADKMGPGLYRVTVSQTVQRDALPQMTLTYTTGFWMHDEALLSSGQAFTVDGDYFLKNGKPYPVTGTTYMTSDIHRKFLFEPNVWTWHSDFARMKETGINMVRTGIWTAWRNYMLDPGVLNETTMRSMDAFLLTARSFDIPVIFTFFAFLPELWNGENAYLDPRSVDAQKEFVALIVRRYSGMNDLLWDLINEPSFCSPQNLWSCRPNYDRFEQHAWNEWLKQRYPSGSDDQREELLRQQYRLRPDESLGLPVMGDFTGSAILYDKRPLKTVDYKFFAQATFAAWSKTMAETIRSNGNPKQLITIGQDEAGTGDSPSPHFFADMVDFTSLHNWWLNDDLVWDSVMTKVYGKANLIEETGVMFYEKADGSPFRTELQAAELLDRKIAISIGTGGAGFIQWIWNINPLMKNDNEATIGLIRADGTVKPEFDVVKKYASFMNKHKNIFTERVPEDVVMLIPHSQIFSPRNSATEATKRAVRTLTYGLGIPVRTVAEHADRSFLSGVKLIVVPAPRTLTERGWELLKDAANAGATVMISGIIDDDEFYRRKGRSAMLNHPASSSIITQSELVRVGGIGLRFSFRGDKMQQLEKAVVSSTKEQELAVIPFGKGTFLWSPVPVENSESIEEIMAYYKFCAVTAGISPLFTKRRKDPSQLLLPQQFKNHVLYTLVSETNEESVISFTYGNTDPVHTVTVPAQHAVLLLVDRQSGVEVGRTEGV